MVSLSHKRGLARKMRMYIFRGIVTLEVNKAVLYSVYDVCVHYI